MRDLRRPLAIFFAVLGALLVSAGNGHAALSNAPVNLYTGSTLLLFSGIMLALAYMDRRP